MRDPISGLDEGGGSSVDREMGGKKIHGGAESGLDGGLSEEMGIKDDSQMFTRIGI